MILLIVIIVVILFGKINKLKVLINYADNSKPKLKERKNLDELIYFIEQQVEFCEDSKLMENEKWAFELVLEKAKKETITVTRCSTQLPTLEKAKLIDHAYWLNLQNLSGREDFEKAFRTGIEVGVNETLEKLQEKAIV